MLGMPIPVLNSLKIAFSYHLQGAAREDSSRSNQRVKTG